MQLHDAELRTHSWQVRHSPAARKALGALRWMGVSRHQRRINRIRGEHPLMLDFGGFDGPYPGAEVCDIQGGTYQSLDEVPAGRHGTVFTSHTLEHIADLDAVLSRFRSLGAACLIAHVPAWTCTRWRADQYANPNQGTPHVHTFCLRGDAYDGLPIDETITRHFPSLEVAEHCGDDSILVIAWR